MAQRVVGWGYMAQGVDEWRIWMVRWVKIRRMGVLNDADRDWWCRQGWMMLAIYHKRDGGGRSIVFYFWHVEFAPVLFLGRALERESWLARKCSFTTRTCAYAHAYYTRYITLARFYVYQNIKRTRQDCLRRVVMAKRHRLESYTVTGIAVIPRLPR